ncbi:uncharacterized protein METZ01_LOCUS391684 [marine metagenome]|uniref:KTSC domain-containing protein n=1 Tax=marine metagenome TaxID=408172 RepID=A0A382UX88_9ZZZZ
MKTTYEPGKELVEFQSNSISIVYNVKTGSN